MKTLIFKSSKLIKPLITILIIFLILALAIFPDKYSKSTYEGLVLWAVAVLPSLLPYFFLTAVLTKLNVLSNFSNKCTPLTNKTFHLNGCAVYAFLMSVLSGYPVGSKITLDLYEKNVIDKNQCLTMGLLCSTSGPLFIIGAVGTGMFLSKTAGYILYVSHVLSALINAFIFRGKRKNCFINDNYLSSQKSDNLLYDCVYSSVISALIVGGFVSVFYVISEIFLDLKILYPLTALIKLILLPFNVAPTDCLSFSVGLIEFTKGAKLLSEAGANSMSLSLTCFLITFGGASAIMQSLAFLKKAKVKTGAFILGKFTQGLIASVICFILCSALL